ncbi:ABC transporter ATP-binding protein [Metabacillus iocasae]|uniref:Quaternary amine transport ATP-binding protein n=1 Tax=Priestia iocasae TaxID=2291674 RepID=A0ABS2QUD7_9BACI|nr:ABC transporter ATP-binding protein [Metabacillus iocasae]MBM7703104.1 osmoprotectant transport system ATP-binding protein [Metabacillus iocasae]
MITFKHVSKVYEDGTKAVDDVDLEIKDGEFFVFIGPSGCGKTTTLKLINRLHEVTDGDLYIHDKRVIDHNIHELRWNIGYVLQQIALFPHMTIAENISIVPELKAWKKEDIKNRVDELLELVGLEPETYRNRKPSELSGGQQQRVGVARALAADPPIILMDEPFSALDPLSREQLQEDFLRLKEKIKKTIVFVTHDMSEALKIGDRICLMKDGKVVQVGTPEDFIKRPKNEFVKSFIGDQQSVLDLSLKEFIQQGSVHIPIEGSETIDAEATISDALEKLRYHDGVRIIENDIQIGVITRQSVVSFLYEQNKERRVMMR